MHIASNIIGGQLRAGSRQRDSHNPAGSTQPGGPQPADRAVLR